MLNKLIHLVTGNPKTALRILGFKQLGDKPRYLLNLKDKGLTLHITIHTRRNYELRITSEELDTTVTQKCCNLAQVIAYVMIFVASL